MPRACRFAHVVRTTVFLADMNDFQAMNEVYATFFSEPYPARSTVQAARLPRDARIEIDVIASYEVGLTSDIDFESDFRLQSSPPVRRRAHRSRIAAT